jgi:paraquat-inducible protein B
MSRKANPTLIGLFIVLGLGLGVGAVLFFSSSRLFTNTKQYILYFDASLTGLDPGAAVKFRGVTIGAVKDVLIHFNQAPTDTTLPVIIELNEDLLKQRSDAAFNLADAAQFEASVQRGLRGKLEAQSLLTGLLYVNLEFLPGTPTAYHQVKPIYPEIPAAPVEVQIFQVDFASIVQKLNSILVKLDASLGEIKAAEINRGLTNLLASLNTTVNSPGLTNTLASLQQTLRQLSELSTKLQSRAEGLADGADLTLVETRATLAEFRQGVQDVRGVLSPQAPLRRDVEAALGQFNEAARAVSELAEFLTRHPNAILTGKKPAPTKP